MVEKIEEQEADTETIPKKRNLIGGKSIVVYGLEKRRHDFSSTYPTSQMNFSENLSVDLYVIVLYVGNFLNAHLLRTLLP
jgi:hypothetical protein